MYRLVFFGTPAFATPFLKALLDDEEMDVIAVVTQPDKPSGRGKTQQVSPVKQLALSANIPVLQPATLKSTNAVAQLAPLQADLFVVVAYGKIIPQAVLDVPKRGSINVHPSLLPAYRGPSPMQWAIAEGDTVTGVSIMLLDAGMDTGPLLACESIEVSDQETYLSLVEKVHAIGPSLLVSTLKRYLHEELVAIPQDHNRATSTRLLEREDGHVHWNQPIAVIERKARAYEPWPGAWAIWNRHNQPLRLKLLRMQPADFRADVPPGTVVVKNKRLFVDGSDGTLELLTVQLEGKAPMDAETFLRGYSDVNTAVLV